MERTSKTPPTGLKRSQAAFFSDYEAVTTHQTNLAKTGQSQNTERGTLSHTVQNKRTHHLFINLSMLQTSDNTTIYYLNVVKKHHSQ